MKAQHTLRYWTKRVLMQSLPHNTFGRVDKLRRWRYYRKAGIVFVHVPKAAGSSVTTVLYGRRLGHHTATELMNESPKEWADLAKFAIMRNPAARFLSAYAFAMGAGTREGAVRWRPEYDRPEFRDANVFVQDYVVRGSIYDKDIVFWPQCHFVCDAAGEPFADLRLFRSERFGAVETFLTERGYSAPPQLNRGHLIKGLQMALSSQTQGLLYDLYSKDFELCRRLEAE